MNEQDADDTPDAGMLNVYKEGEEPELKLPMSDLPDTKPAIEELSSVKFDGKDAGKKPLGPVSASRAPVVAFDWETAPRVEAKYDFMNRGDLIFVNFHLKGYDKVDGVRYAFSENELFMEVRVPNENKVVKLGQTLFRPIVVKDSHVQLLTDYVVFKLRKAESMDDIDTEETWSQLGYDVKSFTTPEKIVSLQSNFLKTPEQIE